jgi:glycosyltransferase involved in cell wall biosynthesis
VLVAPIIKAFNRQVKIAHWAYDLYPEAPIAEGMLKEHGFLTRFLKKRLKQAYRACNLIADLGPCMRRLIDKYNHSAQRLTLVPWALSEPLAPEEPDPKVRQELFGNAKLALLYSGNFGRAHSYEEILALARKLRGIPPQTHPYEGGSRGGGIHFCFAVRGNRAEELQHAVTAEDTNISFAGFASEEELAKRLASADIHLASLRPNWTGVVVPSKFFGSLAAGRPVLFAGDTASALAQWIRDYQVGWELRSDSLDATSAALIQLANQPETLKTMQKHCHEIYHQHFARKVVMQQWDQALGDVLKRETE